MSAECLPALMEYERESARYALGLLHEAAITEADQWLATLRQAGGFLLRSPRHKGMFPRAWTRDGAALGWPP